MNPNPAIAVAKTMIKAGVFQQFIGRAQIETLKSLLDGEEGEHFAMTLIKLAETIEKMPKTYETDGQGDNAIVYLHYFYGGIDAWITEKDYLGKAEGVQSQAFGKITLTGNKEDAELGYIDISALIGAGCELDLYWEPKKLKEL